MKLNETEVKAEGAGLMGTQQFSIKMSPKAFDILSAQLYSNRILAPIRELICNAYDAAKENFKVTLPTSLTPIFSVQDFGPGMTEAEITQLYTTYFESTKAATNDSIGGFGLGSKSPFAYVDQFTIESWRDGKKLTFICYRDKGIPTISKIGEVDLTPSDPPHSFKVSFPVKLHDAAKFESEYTAFAKMVPFKINSNVSVDPFKLVETYPGVFLERSATSPSYLYRDCKIYARMGIVSYPIKGVLDHTAYNDLATVVFDFPIGALSISPSRESLSFDNETITAIKKAHNTYIAGVSKDIEAFVKTLSAVDVKAKIDSLNKLVHKYPNWAAFINFPDKLKEPDKVFNDPNYFLICGNLKIHYKYVLDINIAKPEKTEFRFVITATSKIDPNAPADTYKILSYNKVAEHFVRDFGNLNVSVVSAPSYRSSIHTEHMYDCRVGEHLDLIDTVNSWNLVTQKDPKLDKKGERLRKLIQDKTTSRTDFFVKANLEDISTLKKWFDDNLAIFNSCMGYSGHRFSMVEVELDDYMPAVTAKKGPSAKVPAACFVHQKVWTDTTILIAPPSGEDLYFTKAENRYVSSFREGTLTCIKLFYNGSVKFYAFPKSRFVTLSKEAKAAGWKDLADLDLTKIDLVKIANMYANREYLAECNGPILRLHKIVPHKIPAELAELAKIYTDSNWGMMEASYAELSNFLTSKGSSMPKATVAYDDAYMKGLFKGKEDFFMLLKKTCLWWPDKLIIDVFN